MDTPELQLNGAHGPKLDDYIALRGSAKAGEAINAVTMLRAFLSKYGPSRFELLDPDESERRTLIGPRAGFWHRRDNKFFILSDAWREIFPGMDPKRAARAVFEARYLREGDRKGRLSRNGPEAVRQKKTGRVYEVFGDILDHEDDAPIADGTLGEKHSSPADATEKRAACAIEALEIAQRAGVFIAMEAGKPVIQSAAKPSDEIVALLREHREGVIEAVTPDPSGWIYEDYRRSFLWRAQGAVRGKRKLKAETAARRAWEECVELWMDRNPTPEWPTPQTWKVQHEEHRERAILALAKMGIAP